MAHSSAHASGTLHYLTVQDMIWINLQVARKVNAFDFARLEEAAFYQYGYGSSRDLAKQAAQFADGFKAKAPFSGGNEATCFVGLATFLFINGMRPKASDSEAKDWFAKASQGGAGATEAVRAGIEPDPDAHSDLSPNVEECAGAVLARYPATIAGLLAK